MNARTYPIVILLLCIAATGAIAQRSVVFHGDVSGETEGNIRPKPRLRLLQAFAPRSVPLAIEPRPSSPPSIPNINVSYWLRSDQDEPSLAINPLDENNIILSCNDYRSDSSLWYFTSNDGGASWSGTSFISNWPLAGTATDPAVAFDATGNAFVSYGRAAAGVVAFPMFPMNDVVSFRSSDKGNSWIGPTRAVFDSTTNTSAVAFADKYYIATDPDPASPNAGNVYLTWAEYEAGADLIVFSRSTDYGASWSNPVDITKAGNFQSPIPLALPGGKVVVAYEDIDPANLKIHVAISNDGGMSFASDVVVSSYSDLGRLYPPTGYRHPVVKGHVRVNSFPSIAVDRSPAHPGRLYLTYAAMGADLRQHIYLSTSNDNAANWSLPVAIESDGGSYSTDKFFPWIAVDPSNGDIGIVYYDSRNDSLNNELIDAYMLFSNDSGAHFSPLRLSTQSFDTKATSSRDSIGWTEDDSLTFIGDYLSIDGRSKKWVAAWTDMRVGYDQEIYVALVHPYGPMPVRNFQSVENMTTHQPDLSWQFDAKTIAGDPLASYQFHLRRSDGAVDKLLSASTLSYHDDLALPKTDYHYAIQVVTTDDTSTTAETDYFTRARWEPLAATTTSATAQPSGIQTKIALPMFNAAGDTLHGLNEIIYLLDDQVYSSIKMHDAQRGTTIEPFIVASDGFHKFQHIISVMLPSGDTILSAASEPHWLYAGAPMSSYDEDFSFGNTTFTISNWNLTNDAGKLPAYFMNDSAPNVNYSSGTDTWFCLPSVTISDQTKTLEFDQIAAVASSDSAWLEYSLDDGVSYQRLAEFDSSTYPNQWKHSLDGSSVMHSAVSLKDHIGKDVIARFRLQTTTSDADGWFVGRLKYSDALGVNAPMAEASDATLIVSENPVGGEDPLSARLVIRSNAIVSVGVYDLLGRKVAAPIESRRLAAGEYEMNIPGLGPGMYSIVARCESRNSVRYARGRVTIIR